MKNNHRRYVFINAKAFFFLLKCFIVIGPVWSQTLYTEISSYTWTNKMSVPVYVYIPGGQGITSTELNVVLGNTTSYDYFITYPDGTTDYITVGTVLSTYNSGTGSGYSVSFLKTATAGTYKLTIRKDPTGTVAFTDAAVFGLTLDQLGAANTLTATVAFYGPASVTPPAGIIPNGYAWADIITSTNTSSNVYFQIPGNTSPTDNSIHSVNLYLKFSGTTMPSSFSLKAKTNGSAAPSQLNVEKLGFTTINEDFGAGLTGVHIQLFDESNGFYRLEIIANDIDCSTMDYWFGNNEYWQLTINYSHTGTDYIYGAAVSFQSFGDDTVGSNITQDPNIVYRPPLAVIRNPGNIHSDNLAKVVVDRAFRYTSDPFDADTVDGSLSYEWRKNTALFASHATEQNPNFDDTFSSTGTNSIALKITESYTPNTAFGSPYTNFTQASTDSLSLEVVALPFALLLSPSNGADDVSTGTAFRWTDVADELSGSLTYTLYISEDPSFAGCIPLETARLPGIPAAFRAAGIFCLITGIGRGRKKGGKKIIRFLLALLLFGAAAVSCPLTGGGTLAPEKNFTPAAPLDAGTLYYWKVRATDAFGATSDSAVWYFTTE